MCHLPWIVIIQTIIAKNIAMPFFMLITADLALMLFFEGAEMWSMKEITS